MQLIRSHLREIPLETSLDHGILELTLLRHRSVRLCYQGCVLIFRTQVNYILRLGRHFAFHHPTVRSLNEAQPVHLRIHAKGTDQTNVGTLRGLDGAQTTIVGVVNVTHLKACPLT